MPATLDMKTLGSPVEISAIAKELKKLWASDQTRTRATLFNFAILCEGEAAMNENTALLSRFVGSHAFRAVLIGMEPGSDPAEVKAWINAHCYLPKAGARHVCSEQISLFIRGDARSLLPNLLFAQLDSDLPLTVWWRGKGEFCGDSELCRWIDRLIFDTADWGIHTRERLQEMRRHIGTHRTVLCDLAWTRTLRLRQNIAQIFDGAAGMAALQQMRRITITHAPGARSSAVLIAGWFAAQMGWYAHGPGGQRVRFSGTGEDVLCDFIEAAGATISKLEMESPQRVVTATRHQQAEHFAIRLRDGDGTVSDLLMPADSESLWDTLNTELSNGGRHRVYLKALTASEPLLS